jgi:uncharacterized protein YcaQ
MPSSKNILISKSQARKIALRHTGLGRLKSFKTGKGAVLRAITQLGYIQIDTISVVQRAHHHVLWSRVPDYKPEILHDLQTIDRKIFEYWSHAAAFLPIEDFRFSLPRKRSFKDNKDRWPKADPKLKKEVFHRILQEGPLMERDFEAELETCKSSS